MSSFLSLSRTGPNCIKTILATWALTILFCLPLLLAYGTVVPPGTDYAYCNFMDNTTIPFMPGEVRWSYFVYQVRDF